MIIDALQCGHFDRGSFEALRRGGYSAVTPTLGFWEGTMESLDSLARWRDMERENADLILIARTAADIERAETEGKLAVVLGYQNSNLFEDRIAFVEFFAELGVRVVQLTYNNQNELGGSCYEENDSGLARFGRDVVREMNRVGMLVDLSMSATGRLSTPSNGRKGRLRSRMPMPLRFLPTSATSRTR